MDRCVLPKAGSCMKHGVWIIALLVLLGPAGVEAQVVADCGVLEERLERQDSIRGFYGCAMRSQDRSAQRRTLAVRRCQLGDQARLRDLAEQQAEALERCVAAQIGVRNAKARSNSLKPAAKAERPGAARRGNTSGQRIKDLLAEGPRLGSSSATSDKPRARDWEFRSGLVWSYAGPITGMHCVQWREPSDPNKWDDNFLCTERDVGFQWSFRGPILGRGLKCIQVREKSDPHDWHDNYFCWPRDLNVAFRFSATGRIAGQRCVAIVEPSDPHTWRDNYLCHTRVAG
ncbi:MAG: hypothetical protein ACI9XZ_000449 [Alphaproteobacteria bacterium]|jgi:hypothetical protein